jgi:predicted NodU family carbamoyl transferase
MKMKQLLLTLGHNSSAILIEDGELKWGYETERVSRQKSDSRFPEPVLELMKPSKVDMVYVTHWAPDGKLSGMSLKHWDPERFDRIPIRTLSPERSHHDTHMYGAVCYAGWKFPYTKGTYGIVVDGFGTFGEHLSIYDISTAGKPLLKHRYHGYGTSMGLWYQYATAFMGMKMHEDEYKILGYEAHVPLEYVVQLNAMADERAAYILDAMGKSVYGSAYDPLYDLSALANVKDEIFSNLTNVCLKFGLNPHDNTGRIVLGYYVQRVLEEVVLTIISDLNPRNLILSGGCFYNVKLNKRIIDMIEGKICVYPLAGDQGNALGLYFMDHPEFEFPGDLNWGKRLLHDVGSVPNLTVVSSEVIALDLIRDELQTTGYVNLVRGAMEFGPRAMCNTSTLAMPSPLNVQKINAANNRNSFMPMAPVMLRKHYESLFEHTDRVWKSEEHMIVGMEYKEHPLDQDLGIAHEYDVPYHHHTGRPQVARANDDLMQNLLHRVGPLINTSFNFHGHPIPLGMSSIVDNHMMQYRRDQSIKTIVVQND